LTWIIDNLKSGESKTIHITVRAENIGTYKAYAIKIASNLYDWSLADEAQTSYILVTEQNIGSL